MRNQSKIQNCLDILLIKLMHKFEQNVTMNEDITNQNAQHYHSH
jgi:hypothetical protein